MRLALYMNQPDVLMNSSLESILPSSFVIITIIVILSS